MPELPEVEITARRLDAALAGAQIESVLAPGLNALKTFDPPLRGARGPAHRGGRAPRQAARHRPCPTACVVLVHLMSAGRLQLYGKRAGPRDRTSRLLIRVSDPERELRLREFGTKQAAWVKVLRADGRLEDDELLKTLGPEAWPAAAAGPRAPC